MDILKPKSFQNASATFYSNKNLWKILLLLFAILIGIATLWYTEGFLKELREEERKKVELWAEAINVAMMADGGEDLNLASLVMQGNTTIPLILVSAEGEISTYNNIKLPNQRQEEFLQKRLKEMAKRHEPIEVNFGEGQSDFIYYDDSTVLRQLRIYPRILLAVIASFVLISYAAFSSARKAEQERVWSGLAKETAHQIGTPLSSLYGWIELLRLENVSEQVLKEMEKDLQRLNIITDRFSKIGSVPKLEEQAFLPAVEEVISYLRVRVSKKIVLDFQHEEGEYILPYNKPLFEWVLENLIRNAMDAITGWGRIEVKLSETLNHVIITVKDTGKGLPKRHFKTIFRPGFTTKSRGWGLGLSLSKRIINEYHQGKIFVESSELGKGTCFKIILPKKHK